MIRSGILLVLALALALPGCGTKPETPAPELSTGPLTVEEWKALPIQQKYEPDTYERLKKADKSLQANAAWDRFMKTVVLPNREKEIPGPWGTYKESYNKNK